MVVKKMLAYVEKLTVYCENYDYNSFVEDGKLVDACVFNLSQIGELCHAADDDYIREHPEVPWHEMYGLRNRIVHDYEGVNLRLVWEIISRDIPELKKTLQSLF